ncbi:hypothetical protein [Marinicella gelatinilytica]|uniref:hypothetical protein n=1 Tax=Marinicella gelatinilytica TaxID=2996017 RepID=UPI002260913D|nr:hypothetical protein [Marinicella gelatinilytica]MCX7545519.1 hypothetical protein [Marinicella gelatinilytica]
MKYTHLKANLLILTLCIMVSGCGKNQPKLTHFAAINERFQTVYESDDKNQLKTISQLFYDRYEANDVAAEFQYLLDVSTKDGTERWRCSADGYCQRRTIGTEILVKIYRLERYRELYELVNLTAGR